MLLADYISFQDTRSRFQRINSRINTLLYDLTGKYGSRIQMCKCCCRSRVSQVIGRYIYSLYRSNRTGSCRSDTLLKFTHLSCQCRLITYGRRHTSKKCRYLRTGLYKTENIINKQKYISVLCITEIFSHCKTCFRNTHTGSRRLIHLSEH